MHAKYSENHSGNRIKSFFSLRCSVSLFYFIRPVLAIRDNSRYSLFRPAEPVTKRPDILRCCVLGFCCRFRESHLQIHFAVSVRRSPGQPTQLYTAPAVRANRWSVTSCTLRQTVPHFRFDFEKRTYPVCNCSAPSRKSRRGGSAHTASLKYCSWAATDSSAAGRTFAGTSAYTRSATRETPASGPASAKAARICSRRSSRWSR